MFQIARINVNPRDLDVWIFEGYERTLARQDCTPYASHGREGLDIVARAGVRRISHIEAGL